MTTLTDGEPALADTDFRCKHCDRPMWRKGTPPERRPVGSVLHSGRGACGACYHRLYTVGGNAEAVTAVTTVEPVTVTAVTDPATAPLWHARRVTAGRAGDVAIAAELLELCGLLPAQLTGESAHLLDLNDFDKARALLDETNEEESMATALDTTPELDMSPAAIRAWAKGQRLRVASLGMIPRAIVNAYLAAQGIPLAEQELIARPTAPVLDQPPVTVEPSPVTPDPDPVTVTPEVEMPEPATVAVEMEPDAELAGTVGTAIVHGWEGRQLVMRVAHSAHGEIGWVAATAWPITRFGILFEDDEVTDFDPDANAGLVAEVERLRSEFGAKVRLAQEQARTIELLQRDLAAAQDELDAAYHVAAPRVDVDDRTEPLTVVVERLRDKARVEANRLAVELAEALQGGEQARQAAVVSTLPGPLPEEIVELLAAWHALFAKATDVDTGAAHTLAEIATPALVLEASDRIHDLIRLLDGDTSR